MAKKKVGEAEQLDEVRIIPARIEAVRVSDREVELRFRICGSVEFEGGEYSYDEKVSVTAGKCMLTDD